MATKAKIQIYGQGKGQKDQAQLHLEEQEKTRQKFQVHDPILQQIKTSKVFEHGLQKYIAKARLNQIVVMSEHGLQLIDVITSSHDSEIQCLDVADISKDIVSFSSLVVDGVEVNKQLVVHSLQHQEYLNGVDAKVTLDMANRVKHINAFQKPTAQHLKWAQIWKCDPKHFTLTSFLNTISLSPQGDAVFLCGNGFLSLWTRDSNLSSHSFSMKLYYAQDLPEKFYAHSLKEVEMGQVIQSQFTPDSRALLCLEKNNQTKKTSLKVWYNAAIRYLKEPDARKKFKSIHYQIDEFSGGMTHQSNLEEMECFEVPQHRDPIVSFKTLKFPQSSFAREEMIPICFLTITSKNQAFLWVEQLSYSECGEDSFKPLEFSCVHTFSCKPLLLDVNYLSLDISNMSSNFKQQSLGSASRMLDPSSDYTSIAKMSERSSMFRHMVEQSHQAPTNDYLVLLSEKHVHLISIEGLRNYPQRAVEVSTVAKIILENPISSLLDACNDSYGVGEHFIQDTIKITCTNKDGQLLQLRKELKGTSKWKVEAEKQLDQKNVQRICASEHLPITALQYENSIAFYRHVDLPLSVASAINSQYLSPNLEFIGAQASNGYHNRGAMKQIRWIPHLSQVVVLYADNTLALVSSSLVNQLLNELTVTREFQDFKQIWREQITLKEGQVSFSQIVDNVLSEVKEPILDFEILSAQQLPPKQGVFDYEYALVIMIFTSKAVEMHESVIRYAQSSNIAIEGDVVASSKLLLEKELPSQLVEVLVSQREEDDSRVYLTQSPKVKCLVKLLNKDSEQEVCFIEATCYEITIKWQTKLPGQESRVGARTGSSKKPELKPLEYDLQCRMNHQHIGLLTRNVGKQWYYLYLYDHAHTSKYEGYLNLLDFIDFEGLDRTTVLKQGFPLDFSLPGCTANTIAIACLDRLFVIGFNGSKWQTLQRVDRITGLDLHATKHLDLSISGEGSMTLLINKQWPFFISKFLKVQGEDVEAIEVEEEPDLLLDEEDDDQEDKPKKPAAVEEKKANEPIQSLYQMDFSLSKSKDIHSLSILHDLFIDGKADFIMKICIQLHKTLQQEKKEDEAAQKKKPNVSGLVNFTVKQLLNEVNTYIENQVVQQDLTKLEEAAAPVASTAVVKPKDNGGFDDFFGGDSDDDDDMDLMDFDSKPAPKAVERKPESAKIEVIEEPVREEKPRETDEKSTEQQFLEIINDLLLTLVKAEDAADKDLIDFLLVFKKIYNKDFFSDEMCSTLMRQLYLETESVDQQVLKDLQLQAGLKEQKSEVIQLLAHHEIYAQMYNEDTNDFAPSAYQNSGQQNLELLNPWDSRKCALALFTVNQDVILDELKDRFDLENNASWDLVRDLCLPVWIKDSYKLRLVVDWISKISYKIAGEQQQKDVGKDGKAASSKAEATSLWYILMNKKSMLISLYQQEIATGGDKVAAMLGQDFSVDRWKKAALKNGMVLRQKQRFLLAVTFFILGNDIQGAIQIINSSMKDPMLAILTCRMLLLQQPENTKIQECLDKVYEQNFIERGQALGDIYLKSIGNWGQKKYVEAVNALQERQPETPQDLLKHQGIEHMFKQTGIFQLKTASDLAVSKQPNKQMEQQTQLLPLVSTSSGYELQRVITKLKKAPRVTEALKLTDSATGYGADMGDIFDDFGSAPKKQEKKEEKKITQLDVDSTELLVQLLGDSMSKKDMVSSLFLIRENREHMDVHNKRLMKQVQGITMQMLADQIQETKTDPNFFNNSDSVHEQIGMLLDFMIGNEAEAQHVKQDMKRQIEMATIEQIKSLQGCMFGSHDESNHNSMFRQEIELRLSAQGNSYSHIPRLYCEPKQIMLRLESKTLVFASYLMTVANQPDINYNNIKVQLSNLKVHQGMLNEIEHIVDCFIIYDHSEQPRQKEFEDDTAQMEFFKSKPKVEIKEEKPKEEPKKAAKPKFDDDFFGGDSSDEGDLMDFDFQAPPKKKAAEPAPEVKEKPKSEELKPARTESQNKLVSMVQKGQEKLHQLNSKVKSSLIMYLCLVLIAGQTRKYYLAMELMNSDNLMHVLSTNAQTINELSMQLNELQLELSKLQKGERSKSEQECLSKLQEIFGSLEKINEEQGKLHLQYLKTLVQQLKSSLMKRLDNLQEVKAQQTKKRSDSDIIGGANESASQESLFYEQWHIDLQDGIEAIKDEALGGTASVGEHRLLLGYLLKQGHVSAESFEFIHCWMQALLASKVTNLMEKHLDQFSGHTENQIWSLVEDSPALLIDLLGSGKPEANEQLSNISTYRVRCEMEQLQDALINPQVIPQKLVRHFKRMSKFLEDQVTVFFNCQLQVLERRYLARAFNPNSPSHEQLFPVLMHYFFKSPSSLSDFCKFLSSESIYKTLNDQYLTLLGQECTAQTEEAEALDKIQFNQIYDYSLQSLKAVKPAVVASGKKKEEPVNLSSSDSATTQLIRELFQTGIELFKQKSEQISDFTFDNSSYTDNIALGLMTSGSREIPTINTLFFRNRFDGGLQLVDEENLTWEECLHRYDELEEIFYKSSPHRGMQPELITSKDDPITCAIDSMLAQKTINFRSKTQRRKGIEMIDTVVEPSQTWNGSPSQQYLATTSNLEITHEDFTLPVDSHPHLPLYISGNRRGIICTWKFGQEEDKSLNQYMPEVDPRQADVKKATVKKLMFNQYGDKILSSNLEGSFAMYQVECQSRQMRKLPIFSLYENVDSRISDFDLVNSDSVIATLSQKSKCVKIYDTMMPYSFGKQAQVMDLKLPDSKTVGNLLLVNKRRQTIYTFNGRTGGMTELDLRKNLQIVNTFQLSKSEEITAVCLNSAMDSLVTGYKDGVVKIHTLDKYYEKQEMEVKQLYLRESIDAFPLTGGKKGSVSRIKIHPKNGGLFASSASGILKLLRPKV